MLIFKENIINVTARMIYLPESLSEPWTRKDHGTRQVRELHLNEVQVRVEVEVEARVQVQVNEM